MLKLQTSRLQKYKLDREQLLWAYCGLDCTITSEVLHNLRDELSDNEAGTYRFELGMVGPAMTMMRRGLRMEETERKAAIAELHKQMDVIGGMRKRNGKWVLENENAYFQRLATAITDKKINYQSTKQLKELFYYYLNIAEIRDPKRGTVSTGRDALEKIILYHPNGEPFARCLLVLRDMHKTLDVLEKGVDEDGRMRCSYNIGGTDTGRWSSSTCPFNTGSNLQNITPSVRQYFIPDEGYRMFYADLDHAESLAVAYVSEDENYIKACTSGDPHSTVASTMFRVALEQVRDNYYRHFTYRDMAKRAGHGTNYVLSPHSLARHMHIEVKQAFRFHLMYLGGELTMREVQRYGLEDMEFERRKDLAIFPGTFPGIRRWHNDVRTQIQTHRRMTTALGRSRVFWDRPTDEGTIRKAVAFEPQSIVGEVLNTGLWKLWKELEGEDFQLLVQVHDAVGGQVKIGMEEKYEPIIKELMTMDLPIKGRTCRIPVSIDWGNNWHEASTH